MPEEPQEMKAKTMIERMKSDLPIESPDGERQPVGYITDQRESVDFLTWLLSAEGRAFARSLHEQQCSTPECEEAANFHCFSCEQPVCSKHVIRLPQWCQFLQDCCQSCYQTLPEERKTPPSLQQEGEEVIS